MRNILTVIAFIFFLSLSGSGCNTIIKPKLSLMVVAGGHGFDTLEFIEMFSDFSNFTFDTVMQPRANRMIAEGKADKYDVLVFYDMWPDLDSAAKAGYYRLLDRGKGMVFLHHSLVPFLIMCNPLDVMVRAVVADFSVPMPPNPFSCR